MLRRVLVFMLIIAAVGVLAVPLGAQEGGLFNDGRLDTDAAAPIVLFCRFDNGLEGFVATGGMALNASRIQIEGALAQAILDETPIQVAVGDRGTRLIAYPDGGLLVTSGGDYNFTVPPSACGGYSPDYSRVVRLVVDLVDFVNAEVDEAGNLVATEDSMSFTSHSGHTTHTVRRGENLYRIGLRYGVHYTEIARANNLASVDNIYAGQVLAIP